MTESAHNLLPPTIQAWLHPLRVAALLEAGDPARVDRAAAQLVLDEGGGVFEGYLLTGKEHGPAIYGVDMLDAAIITHDGLVTRGQVLEPPPGVTLPEAPGDKTPIIVPRKVLELAYIALQSAEQTPPPRDKLH